VEIADSFSATNAPDEEAKAGPTRPETPLARRLRGCVLDARPEYRARWDLAEDPKLEEGAAYMATLNPREPACFVIAGLVALRKNDHHLAIAAFRRAIALRTTQRDLLEPIITRSNEFITESLKIQGFMLGLALLALAVISLYCVQRIRAARRARSGPKLSGC
jgi:hypothetical protein